VDIQHLVDRLEDLIDEGRHIFGTKYTMIDEERALELIDQMRISIPEEIEKAARVLAQRDRILAESHEESARIVQQHRDRAEKLIDDNAMVVAAQARADSIRESARQEATRITSDADQYVMTILAKLEQQLLANISQVRNGITVLQESSAQKPAVALPSQPVHIPRPVDGHHSDELVDAGYDDQTRYSGQ
jgi:cell division septum initiation protein DivIVA